jgi:hypothetical protein
VDSVGELGWHIYPSIALDSNYDPHISYYTGEELKYAYWTGSEWVTETLSAESVRDTSLDLDSENRPYIVYYVPTTRELKLARGIRYDNQVFLPLVLKP